MIKTPIDHIPAAAPAEGHPPARNTVLVHELADRWFAKYKADGKMDYASAIPELPYRASLAGSRCDRQTYYRMAHTEESNPNTVADVWRMNIGSMIHEALGDTLANLGPQWKQEVNVDLRTIGIPGSAHADLVRHDDNGTPNLVAELKSINGFGFKDTATNFKGPAKGPKFGHILQGLLAASALGVDKLVVAYLSLENLSPAMAAQYSDSDHGRFAAEWQYRVSALEPTLTHERGRILRLVNAVETETLPARTLDDPEYPAGATVVDWPKSRKARWHLQSGDRIVQAGETWMCDYCTHRDICIADGVGTAVTLDHEFF